MSYSPATGDTIRFTGISDRSRTFRVDQVITTDELKILGVVVSTMHRGKRPSHLYDLVTFLSFGPEKVTKGGPVEPSAEASSQAT